MNGIFATSSDWVYIFGNNIYNNSDHGIDVVNSYNGSIIQNNIHTNGWWSEAPNALCGIYLGGGTIDWIVSENSIWNNTPSGITLEGSSKALIENNEIFDNAEEGVNAFNSAALKIFENRVFGNGWDVENTWEGHGIITAGNVADSRIEGNEVFSNTHYGIYAYGNRIDIVGNEVYDHVEWGIGAIMSQNDTVSENIVYDNAISIYVYSIGTNVTNNIVFDNDLGIFVYGSSDCLIYGNDVGWNVLNAQQNNSQQTNLWYDADTDTGNHWHDFVEPGGEMILRYPISNGTDVVAFDNYPSPSLNVTTAQSVDFEILETGNVIEWGAYAMNPSHYEVLIDGEIALTEEWTGGNVEYLADGLAHGLHTIELKVYHFSQHYQESSTSADVEDLTPPSAIFGQGHVVIVLGDVLSEQYISEDPSGVLWSIDDTDNFAISSTGLLTSLTDLAVGQYNVKITASDPYGHSTDIDVQITVNAPPGGLPTSLIIVLGGGGAVVVVVIIIVVLKKKSV